MELEGASMRGGAGCLACPLPGVRDVFAMGPCFANKNANSVRTLAKCPPRPGDTPQQHRRRRQLSSCHSVVVAVVVVVVVVV